MREQVVFNRIVKRAQSLATGTTENEALVYALCCRVWIWKQKYRSEGSTHRVAQRDYQSLIQEIDTFESRIIAGKYERQAKEAVADVRAWVELAIAYRVPAQTKGKCRVF